MSFDSSIGVVALVPDAWHDIVMPRHHVLKRLARHFPVVWVNPQMGWREYFKPSGGHFLEGDRWYSPSDGLEVFTPGLRHAAVLRPNWLHEESLKSNWQAARRRLLDRGAKRVVLYLWRDEFAAALDAVEHDLSCYHLDDEYSFDEKDRPISPREYELLRRADQVIVHSPGLEAKKGGINPNTARIPNGVDYTAFATPQAEPPDLARITRPRIGYAGIIKRQLDLALMVRLAHARPNYSFVFVGPEMNMSGKEQFLRELKALPNVFFLGNKPTEALPHYVQHFDVCLMCYDVNDYTKYIYPLKLNEYLATGRPTVSSPIDAVCNSESVVTLARSDSEWLDAISFSLSPEGLTSTTMAARQKVAREHDWDTLVDRIANLFRDGLVRADSIARSHGRELEARIGAN